MTSSTFLFGHASHLGRKAVDQDIDRQFLRPLVRRSGALAEDAKSSFLFDDIVYDLFRDKFGLGRKPVNQGGIAEDIDCAGDAGTRLGNRRAGFGREQRTSSAHGIETPVDVL